MIKNDKNKVYKSGIPNILTFNGQSYADQYVMVLPDFIVQFMMNLIQIVRT